MLYAIINVCWTELTKLKGYNHKAILFSPADILSNLHSVFGQTIPQQCVNFQQPTQLSCSLQN